jgi:hypothetical protein
MEFSQKRSMLKIRTPQKNDPPWLFANLAITPIGHFCTICHLFPSPIARRSTPISWSKWLIRTVGYQSTGSIYSQDLFCESSFHCKVSFHRTNPTSTYNVTFHWNCDHFRVKWILAWTLHFFPSVALSQISIDDMESNQYSDLCLNGSAFSASRIESILTLLVLVPLLDGFSKFDRKGWIQMKVKKWTTWFSKRSNDFLAFLFLLAIPFELCIRLSMSHCFSLTNQIKTKMYWTWRTYDLAEGSSGQYPFWLTILLISHEFNFHEIFSLKLLIEFDQTFFFFSAMSQFSVTCLWSLICQCQCLSRFRIWRHRNDCRANAICLSHQQDRYTSIKYVVNLCEVRNDRKGQMSLLSIWVHWHFDCSDQLVVNWQNKSTLYSFCGGQISPFLGVGIISRFEENDDQLMFWEQTDQYTIMIIGIENLWSNICDISLTRVKSMFILL